MWQDGRVPLTGKTVEANTCKIKIKKQLAMAEQERDVAYKEALSRRLRGRNAKALIEYYLYLCGCVCVCVYVW